jgi:hypothetical protein
MSALASERGQLMRPWQESMELCVRQLAHDAAPIPDLVS